MGRGGVSSRLTSDGDLVVGGDTLRDVEGVGKGSIFWFFSAESVHGLFDSTSLSITMSTL
jgi:hypothetical protein